LNAFSRDLRPALPDAIEVEQGSARRMRFRPFSNDVSRRPKRRR
jgi:hypothetical protein